VLSNIIDMLYASAKKFKKCNLESVSWEKLIQCGGRGDRGQGPGRIGSGSGTGGRRGKGGKRNGGNQERNATRYFFSSLFSFLFLFHLLSDKIRSKTRSQNVT